MAEAAGSPVADVEGAFAVTNFSDMVELKGFGLVPLNVARACEWTLICGKTGDLHPNKDGHIVIAQAFLDVLAT